MRLNHQSNKIRNRFFLSLVTCSLFYIGLSITVPQFEVTTASPGFHPLPQSQRISNGTTFGLFSPFASSLVSLSWSSSSAEFPAVTIIESGISFEKPKVNLSLYYEYTNDFSDQYVGPWSLYTGAELNLEYTWEEESGCDMMDFGLYGPNNPFGVHQPGYGDDELTDWVIKSPGCSPEEITYRVKRTGEYWIRIINYAGTPNRGYVHVYAINPVALSATSFNNSVTVDTIDLEDGVWLLCAYAVDSLEQRYSYQAYVILNNYHRLPLEIEFDLPSSKLSGIIPIHFSIFDPNFREFNYHQNNSLYLNIYYSIGEHTTYWIPIALGIDVKEYFGDEFVFHWNTSNAINAYIAKLKVVLWDAECFIERNSSHFVIWNPENSPFPQKETERSLKILYNTSLSLLNGLMFLLIIAFVYRKVRIDEY